MAAGAGGRGDPARALSVNFLVNYLVGDLDPIVQPDENVYDIEPRIRQKGEAAKCPREPDRLGAAYVDVADDEHAGTATLMLSYTWSCLVYDIVSAIRSYSTMNKYDNTKARVWICCLCVNQHRVKETRANNDIVSFEQLKSTFGNRVRSTGHILGLLSPWSKPLYIERVWCLFEAWMTTRIGGVRLDFVMPEREAQSFTNALSHKGLDSVWDTLMGVNVEEGKASVEEDRRNILGLIKSEGGFKSLNGVMRKRLQAWFLQTARNSPGVNTAAGFSPGLCTHVADLFTLLSLNEEAAEVAQCGLGFCRELGLAGVDYAALELRLGRAYGNLGDLDLAYCHCEHALQRCRKSQAQSELPEMMEAEILRTMAAVQRKRGDLQLCWKTYENALHIYNLHSQNGQLTEAAGWCLLNLGRVRQAITSCQEEVPEGAREALEYYQEAYELYNHYGVAAKPMAAFLLRCRGDAYVEKGMLAAALRDFDEAERIFTDNEATESENFGELRKSQGVLHLKCGECWEATRAFEDSRRILQGLLPVRSKLACVLRDIAELYIDREDSVGFMGAMETIRQVAEDQGLADAVASREARRAKLHAAHGDVQKLRVAGEG